MAHIHDVYDQDNHFVIDPITRDITSQSEKISITQYDHNSERFTFEIPKIIEGHDMSLCDKVRVHFINIGSNRSNVSKGVYEVDDIRVSSDDSDMLLFSWLISRAATEYSGKLNFSIRFYCISDDNIVDYSWATSIFTGIKISNGIDNSEAITEDYVDILEQWKSEIAMKIDDIDSKIENIKIPEIPTALPNPKSLTFTGAAEGTYDGSSALTVDIPSAPDIPTTLPNPQSLTFTGAVEGTYDGSSALTVDIPSAPEIPTQLPNPQSLTFTGAVEGTYDGSSALTVDIPSAPEIPTQLPNPQSLTFTGAAEGTYDGSSALTVDIPQPDWNQNDSSAANYIQNRPFYKEETVGYSIEEQTLEFVTTDLSGLFPDLTLGIANIPNSFNPSVGEDLTVVFDGVEYELRVEASSIPVISAYIGHDEMPWLIGSVTPFTFYKDFNFTTMSIDFTPTGSWTLFTSELTPASHTIAVKKVVKNIVKIPSEYLPEMDSAYVSYSKAQELTDEQKSQARTNIGVDISGKMDKNNPTGTGSYSLNRKAGTIIGDYSHAEGFSTTASQLDSHAEGSHTTASGVDSHAEGYNTTASASSSHAEGYETEASGDYSHAEGYNTTASGRSSHAEGYRTTASVRYSHAEGSYTKASSDNQHVQGKYNVEDSSAVYADIIGNGTDSKKSNAATVDWSGNAWYAGDVYVGSTSGTNKDEGSKKLATEEYVDNSTANIVIPATLPNPNALTFTGAVNTSYDGSSEVSVGIPGALSELSEDATHRVVTDAEKAKWNAKSNFSGSYNDLTDKPTIPDVPVQSVNGKTGAVVLSAEDVGALPGSTVIPTTLPNPQTLTFTGAAEGTYDGSNPLTVEIPVGADGKSAYQYAQDGGYTGTEAEFAEKLAQEQLTGTTDELTPTQVYNAVSAGIPVKVQYTDAIFGILSFTNFSIAENMNLIAANCTVQYNGDYLISVLWGSADINEWGLNRTSLARKTDIPTTLPNPNDLTFTGAVAGSYNGSAPLSVNIPSAVTDDHINELISTALNAIGVAEERAY